ncbi:MAG: hypothetical protein HY903_18195 [Deltaproteobacteria bacterium]|nr:hypothetical protein [Deltaproteobacteria bacterium]
MATPWTAPSQRPWHRLRAVWRRTALSPIAAACLLACPAAAAAAISATELDSDCAAPGFGAIMIETQVYRLCVGQGTIDRLELLQSSSPSTSLGEIEFSLGWGETAGLVAMEDDSLATRVIEADNRAVYRVRYDGLLKTGAGVSYGTTQTTLTAYEDRFITDSSYTLTQSIGTNNAMLFLHTPNWSAARVGPAYRYCSGTCGTFLTATPTTSTAIRLDQAPTPVTLQQLFELGDVDGLVTTTVRDLYGGLPLATATDELGTTGEWLFPEVGAARPAVGTLYRAATLVAVAGTAGGFDTALAKHRHDDFAAPGAVDCSQGDGALVDDGYAEERGAYTLADGDADDHVKLTLSAVATAPRLMPVFEISDWDGPAPATILVDGALRSLAQDYNAGKTGSTLYLQYLRDLDRDTTFELGACTDDPTCTSGNLYLSRGARTPSAATVRETQPTVVLALDWRTEALAGVLTGLRLQLAATHGPVPSDLALLAELFDDADDDGEISPDAAALGAGTNTGGELALHDLDIPLAAATSGTLLVALRALPAATASGCATNRSRCLPTVALAIFVGGLTLALARRAPRRRRPWLALWLVVTALAATTCYWRQGYDRLEATVSIATADAVQVSAASGQLSVLGAPIASDPFQLP